MRCFDVDVVGGGDLAATEAPEDDDEEEEEDDDENNLLDEEDKHLIGDSDSEEVETDTAALKKEQERLAALKRAATKSKKPTKSASSQEAVKEAIFADESVLSKESKKKSKKSKKNEGNMEMVFNTEVEDKVKEAADRIVKAGGDKAAAEKPKSAWAQYLEKRKEKKKEKRQAMKDKRKAILGEDDADKKDADKKEEEEVDEERAVEDLDVEEDDRDFNLKHSKKGKKGKIVKKGNEETAQSGFNMNVNDSRFSAVFEDADYAIDPNATEFQKTQNMDRILEEKRKRKADGQVSQKSGKKRKL